MDSVKDTVVRGGRDSYKPQIWLLNPSHSIAKIIQIKNSLFSSSSTLLRLHKNVTKKKKNLIVKHQEKRLCGIFLDVNW